MLASHPLSCWFTFHNHTAGTTMGDKSPKSTKKLSNQKETKTNKEKRKKQEAENAKRVVSSKK